MAAEKQKNTPEIMEKKEKFLETGTKRRQPEAKGKPPLYFMGALLLLGIVIGAAAIIYYSKPLGNDTNSIIPDTNNTNDIAYKTVPITMVYSDECKSCRQTNTFEELFKVRQIPYVMKKVEASSDEGKQIIARFGLTTLPTAIIDAAKVQFYPSTKKNFDAVLEQKNAAYIGPEMNLNDNYYFPVYFIGDQMGGLCTSEKPTVVQFDDYYTEQNIAGKHTLYNFWFDANATTDIKFSFAQSVSRDENSLLTNLFLMCASKQGKYAELEKAITGIYCNNTPGKGDESVLTDAEVAGCKVISSHYGTPLSPIELDIALNRTSIDTNQFTTCLQDKEVLYNNARNAAIDAGITRAGTFVLDCRETTALEQLDASFCARHPQEAWCGAQDEQQEQ